jgi:hypothetical protein
MQEEELNMYALYNEVGMALSGINHHIPSYVTL